MLIKFSTHCITDAVNYCCVAEMENREKSLGLAVLSVRLRLLCLFEVIKQHSLLLGSDLQF